MHRMIIIAAIALIAAVACGSAFAEVKTFEKKFQVGAGGTLSLGTESGSVSVTGGSGSEVVVTARIEGRSSDIAKFVVEADQSGNNVDVTGKAPKDFWRFLRGNNLDVRFTVTVPRSYNVRLQTSGGDVKVSNLTGKVDGETSGGDVSIDHVEGVSTLGTSGGDIHVESVKGDVKAETSGGNVKMKNVVGNVNGETSGGNISAEDVDGKVRLETSGGNVTIKVRGANKGIHAETSGGNVTIMISKNVGAVIDAGTSGGEVVCDLPVMVSGKISEDHVKGTVNGGGELIYAHTSGGNVQIKPLE
jgi:hypothetical protein